MSDITRKLNTETAMEMELYMLLCERLNAVPSISVMSTILDDDKKEVA